MSTERHVGDGGLLHDIGHDLSTISLLAVAVRDDPVLPPSVRDRVVMLERAVGRLREMVGHRGSSRREVSLRSVLADVVEPRRVAAAATVVLAPGSDVTLALDPDLLRRLVLNLVDNAVRAAGHVTVEILDVASGPAVEIRDDGPGPGRGPAGTAGQGLAIVHALADRCDADVTLAPRPGGGTTARVAFGPGALAQVAPGDPAQVASGPGALAPGTAIAAAPRAVGARR